MKDNKIKNMKNVSSLWKKKLEEEFNYCNEIKLLLKEILGEEIYNSIRITCLKNDLVQFECASSELKTELYMYKRNIEKKLNAKGYNVKIIIKYKGGNIGR